MRRRRLTFTDFMNDAIVTASTAAPAIAINAPQQLVIASRESRLAMWQAEHVAACLRQLYPQCTVSILGMTTQGDQILDRTLSKVGGKGLFVKELEAALLEGRADLAVHSLKDVPMVLPDGLMLSTVMEREDPRDALVSPRYTALAQLPAGAVVGTSSLRRESQLRAAYPQLTIQPLRGNLDTRLGKLDKGEYDAIMLAAAGLKRLGLSERIAAHLPLADSLPAAGQGALGIEIVSNRPELAAWLAPLNHSPTLLAVAAERQVSLALGGSCSVPLAAHAYWQDSELVLQAMVAATDGKQVIKAEARAALKDAAAARTLGQSVADQLIAQGAQAILDALA